MKKYYFDVHVQLPHDEGYSIGVIVDSTETPDESTIIEIASQKDQFEDADDKYCVDYVSEITEEDYKKHFKY